MSEYTGKCVVRIADGTIVDVHVVDSKGIGATLSPTEYQSRGIRPPISELPDCSSGKS